MHGLFLEMQHSSIGFYVLIAVAWQAFFRYFMMVRDAIFKSDHIHKSIRLNLYVSITLNGFV